MCTGKPPCQLKRIFLINFELCRRYVDEDGDLLSPRTKPMFRGSPRYASVNALEEHEQSRTDDLWAWLFSVMEMMLGKLPWDTAEQPPLTVSGHFVNLSIDFCNRVVFS